jgi:trehalose 6-phosphate synthase
MLTEQEIRDYYQGFSNEIIWPLFHDLPGRCNLRPGYWPAYQRVNDTFAQIVGQCTLPDDYVWVQDYHLMLVAQALRARGLQRRTGFFLHVPFPSLDIFMKLPRRFEVLRALTEYGLLGFQTARDFRNFLTCARTLLPDLKVRAGRMAATLQIEARTCNLGVFPIGIDQRKFAADANSEAVAKRAWYIHEDLPNRKLILGIDRLDYSKGIPHRIEALGNALHRYPELRKKVTFIQVVVPSRVGVPEYAELKMEVERLVGQVNGEFTVSGWTPIHYIYRPLTQVDLIAYYRTAEIALITPLKDGMNLVAKEFCAASVEQNAVLILSEFAGAAAQLNRGAILVNPYDVEAIAGAIQQAVRMPVEERRERMRRLQREVRRADIYWWLDAFLDAAFGRRLNSFVAQPEPLEQIRFDASDEA